MRISNQHGRAVLVTSEGRALDIEQATHGKFGPCAMSVFERWEEFCDWQRRADIDPSAGPMLDTVAIEAVVPRPRQVFAIGLNYTDHAEESGFAIPQKPVVFTKYMSSLTGPHGDIELSSETVDWEVELVVVIGKEANTVPAQHAWDYIAGVTIGQDISDRDIQFEAPPAQFGIGKSLKGYSPIGPVVVTVDELPNRDDIQISCAVNGTVRQDGRTSSMIFPIPELIHRLSSRVTLLPGDLIFTGTPAGVGAAQDPKTFLQDGDQLVTRAIGLGDMVHRFITKRRPHARPST